MCQKVTEREKERNQKRGGSKARKKEDRKRQEFITQLGGLWSKRRLQGAEMGGKEAREGAKIYKEGREYTIWVIPWLNLFLEFSLSFTNDC